MYEKDWDGGWLPLVETFVGMRSLTPPLTGGCNRAQPSALYVWTHAIPKSYNQLAFWVNQQPTRVRTLREK